MAVTDHAPRTSEKVLVLAICAFVLSACLIVTFGLLIYPALWETVRLWFR